MEGMPCSLSFAWRASRCSQLSRRRVYCAQLDRKPWGDDGCLYSILQEFCIFGSDFVDGSKFIVGKGLEFDLKDCGLKGAEAGVHADANIVVFERALAMDAVGVGLCCPFIIVCE